MKSVNPTTTAASAPQPGALVNEDTISQCQRMKRHFEAGKTLTAIDALRLFDCMNCKGRIFDLRDRYRMPIITTMTKLANRKRVAVYSLITEDVKSVLSTSGN